MRAFFGGLSWVLIIVRKFPSTEVFHAICFHGLWSFIYFFKRLFVPVHSSYLGALPARFRRTQVLIVGCGDVGMRTLPQLIKHCRVVVLTSSTEKIQALRDGGARPLLGDLDDPKTLYRLAGLSHKLLHLAPPAAQGREDQRTRSLLRALALRKPPEKIVYGSTTGVYGNCHGQWVKETQLVNPQSERALRRVDAEQQLRLWVRRSLQGVQLSTLRIPGIYALDREGGTPIDRVRKGMPVLSPADDVYTNHIHADDLARACVLSLFKGQNLQAIHVSDDAQMKMGDYYALVAQWFNLPQPLRMSFEEIKGHLSPMQMSFLSESRKLDNKRMKKSLGLKLWYPSPKEGLGV